MMLFNIRFLAPVLLAASTTLAVQGGIHGCVTDAQGNPIPGVTIVAAGEGTTHTAIAGPAGCYRLEGVRRGDYSLTATIPGFLQGSRERVEIRDRTARRVDFSLCHAPLDEIDWIVPAGLEEMWRSADRVVRVRISATRPAPSRCPSRNVEHTALVLEELKPVGDIPRAQTVVFIQEQWSGEQSSYRRGDEQIVFLRHTTSGYVRAAGPYSVFHVAGAQVFGYRLGRFAELGPLEVFLARLRAADKR